MHNHTAQVRVKKLMFDTPMIPASRVGGFPAFPHFPLKGRGEGQREDMRGKGKWERGKGERERGKGDRGKGKSA